MVIILNSLGTINLYTNRCILRRFVKSDIDDVYNSYMKDQSVSKYLLNNEHKIIYETELLVNCFINNYNNLNYYNWIIVDRFNFKVIGTISLLEIDVYNDKAEIGVIISKKYQNKGYGKEVVKTIIDFAFYHLKVHRIEAKIMKDNIGSIKLFTSLNFNYEGIIHSFAKKNEKYYDIVLFYLLNL